jgi:RND superfamily putative drug exporter
MDTRLYALGRACVKHRKLVLLIWAVALVGVVVAGKTTGVHYRDNFSVKGVDSQHAADLLEHQFPAAAGASAQVVVHAPTGTLKDPKNVAAVAATEAAIQKLPNVDAVIGPTVDPQLLSPDGTIGLINVSYKLGITDLPKNSMQGLYDAAHAAQAAGLTVDYGGQVPSALIVPKSPPSDAIGLVMAVIILLLAFGSVIAMGLPIGTALFGVGVGIAIIELLSAFVTFPSVTPDIAVMIGLGVGIDYSLFIVTRHRVGLHQGLTVIDAAGRAIATSGQAVLVAGSTVVIAIFGLAIAGVTALTFMGMGAAIVVAVMVVAALTLLPALLGFAGHNIDRLKVPGMTPKHEQGARDENGKLHGWGRWAQHVAAHPWPYLVVSLGVLLLLAAPVLQMRLGEPDASNDPTSSTLRRSYDLLAEGFGAGFNGPLLLAVDLTNVPVAERQTAAGEIAAAVKQTSNVAVVSPPVLSPDKQAAIIQVTPKSAPQAAATNHLVRTLRSETLPATRASGARTYVGGVTAAFIDVSDRLSDRLPYFIGAVIFLAFLLLMWVFRSILVPLKAALMNLLSIGAAYGVIVLIFQKQIGGSLVGIHSALPIVAIVPMFMFAVLFGLSMDYEVFLLSRIREEYSATHDNTESVIVGIATTARVITSAALIMTSVFLAFVLEDNPTVKMLGIGLAVAVLVDATIVRTVLVPATMVLLGDANWWLPKWLGRILPNLDIEGEHNLPAPEMESESGPAPAAEREPAPV